MFNELKTYFDLDFYKSLNMLVNISTNTLYLVAKNVIQDSTN